jgi:hypothetical protein
MCYPVTPRSYEAESSGLEPQLLIHLFSKQRRSPDRFTLHVAVQTGLEPASHTLERRAARPLRFCTIDAVQVEKAVVAHTGIEPVVDCL